MMGIRSWRRCWPLLLFFWAAGAGAADDDTFDISAYEKKPFELGGYVQLKQESFSLNRDGALYKLNQYGEPQRKTLDRSTATMELVGKARLGEGTFDFRTHSDYQHDQLSSDHDNLLYEGAYSLRPKPGVTLEAGKRVMRWGKGYAWNPIGFVERPKDPNDPELAREGFVMADADFIWNREGPLQTIALTPVLLPVSEHVNGDFGAHNHLNPAAKLYLLYRDTDIDFAWQGKGSRPARVGMDFSRNVLSNFEVHGEWARIQQASRPVTDSSGRVTIQKGDPTNWLLGMRYLTEGNTTYIAEYYYNGTGYTESEATQFYRLVDRTFDQIAQTGASPLLQRALSLGQGAYARPNPGKRYLYFRAQQKDAFDIVYFQPAVTAMMNVQDRSFQVTPELMYTGINNLELRFRFFMLHGDRYTDFGEKQNARKVELYARYYF